MVRRSGEIEGVSCRPGTPPISFRLPVAASATYRSTPVPASSGTRIWVAPSGVAAFGTASGSAVGLVLPGVPDDVEAPGLDWEVGEPPSPPLVSSTTASTTASTAAAAPIPQAIHLRGGPPPPGGAAD